MKDKACRICSIILRIYERKYSNFSDDFLKIYKKDLAMFRPEKSPTCSSYPALCYVSRD
jgi:hypothetical protein